MADTRQRDTFKADEMAICLSHFDLGTIYSITEFPRGSRRSPKAIVECENGKFLFKRRNKGVEEIKKVAFTHQIQLALAAQNFPLPHLLGTTRDNNSMLVWKNQIYEMQEFIDGGNYDGSSKSTSQGGHALGLYHKLLENFVGDWEPPSASYHNAKAIYQAVLKTKNVLPASASPGGKPIGKTIDFLGEAYRVSAQKVNELGLKDWPEQIVHGDWHPGNMLFKHQLVVAVIDYDTARMQQRVIDFANGALQFSILGGGEDPLTWPDHLDLKRFKKFLAGYDSVNVITAQELKAIPYLMCEAMIAEAVLPIASTGGFGRFDGGAFMTMIQKKVKWIFKNMKTIVSILDESHDQPAQQ